MFTLPATATPDKLNSFTVTLLADCPVIKGTSGVAPTGVTVIAGVALKPDKLIVVPPDAIALFASKPNRLITFPDMSECGELSGRLLPSSRVRL